MTELVTLASTVGRPRATRVGKRISEPPPAIELIPPARKATPAAMARSRADTTAEITVIVSGVPCGDRGAEDGGPPPGSRAGPRRLARRVVLAARRTAAMGGGGPRRPRDADRVG